MIIDMEVGPQVAGMIRAIKATAPSTRIILLGGVGSMDRAKGAFPQGVDGVVLTMQPPAVLIRMIEFMYRSAAELPNEEPRIDASDRVDSYQTLSGPLALTKREREPRPASQPHSAFEESIGGCEITQSMGCYRA